MGHKGDYVGVFNENIFCKAKCTKKIEDCTKTQNRPFQN